MPVVRKFDQREWETDMENVRDLLTRRPVWMVLKMITEIEFEKSEKNP